MQIPTRFFSQKRYTGRKPQYVVDYQTGGVEMATKEKTGQARTAHPLRSEWTHIGLMQLIEWSMCLLLGALCASAEIFGRCTPFGVAMVAAAGAGVSGFFALSGAVLGYLFFEGVSGGLHYVAASVLTYGIAFAIYDTRLRELRWLMPCVAALLCAVCRFVQLAGSGFTGADVIFFLTEALLLGGAAYFYQGVFTLRGSERSLRQLDLPQRAGVIALGATILCALSAVRFFGDFSLGRIVAAVVVMVVAKGGVNAGLIGGVLAGITMDLSSGRGPYYTMVYAVAGAACGLASKKGKLAAAVCYVVANGLTVLWTWDSGMRIALLYEVFAASVVFFLLPQRIRDETSQILALRAPQTNEWEGARETAVRHVRESAKAFRDLYESIRDSLRPEVGSNEDQSVIYHRAAERECKKCKLRELCWIQEYQTTQQLLGSALQSMIVRGKAEGPDFPPHFRSRCIHFTTFLSAVNEELTAYLYRRQYQGRLHDSRIALCRQYAEVDRILEKAAVEISAEFTPDVPREAHLRQFLRAKGMDGEGRVYFDGSGHLRVETPGSAFLRTEDGRDKLSSLLSVSLRPPEDTQDGRLVFTQAEPYVATAGVYGRSKAGETISGDTGTWFRREDGLLCILLCDGMGSGAAARQESGLAVRLLQNFLKAGVDPEAAISTVNAALSLRGEEGGGCTTVDLLTIELYTGLCSIYKLGAAPTYVRRGNSVSCISGTALPAGLTIGDEAKPDISRFRASPGDWILLMSDGMLTGESDQWVHGMLEGYSGKSPGELAENLFAQIGEDAQGEDDRTVIAVRLDKRG